MQIHFLYYYYFIIKVIQASSKRAHGPQKKDTFCFELWAAAGTGIVVDATLITEKHVKIFAENE